MANNPTDLLFGFFWFIEKTPSLEASLCDTRGEEKTFVFSGCRPGLVQKKKKKKEKLCSGRSSLLGDVGDSFPRTIERVSATIVFLQLDVPRLHHFDGWLFTLSLYLLWATNISRRKGGKKGCCGWEQDRLRWMDHAIHIHIYIYPLCVIFNSWLRQGICKKIGSCNYLNEW